MAITQQEVLQKMDESATRAEHATDAYVEVLTSEGEQDVPLVDGSTTPNLNKRLSKMTKAVQSVAGRTGHIELTPGDIGYPELETMDRRLKEARFIQDASGMSQQEINDYISMELAQKAPLSVTEQLELSKANKEYVDTAFASFQNGAIKTYPTLTAANADIANIALNTKVSILSATEGGDYYKASADATSLTKSAWDPVEQAKADATAKAKAAEDNAKEYTDLKKAEAVELAAKKLNEIVDHSKDEPILRIYDNELSIVAEIDKNSQLQLPDLEYSVQEEINRQKKTASRGGNINDFIHVFSDIEGEVVAGIDKEGGLHLVGSTVPLQEKLNWQKVKLPARQFNERDLFVESANKYILNMSISGNQNAPIPFNLIPQNYTVPDSFVNNYSLNPPTDYLPINTPYGKDDQVVHPYVVEFPGNFRGFRYLMCITPYTVEAHENPVIMGSNDLERWEMLTGFDQPIATPLPGRFLSDNGLAYDPTSGMLICYWRDGITNSSDDTNIYYRATRDGTEWTAPQLLFAADPTSSNLSPSVLFNPNDGLWHMWIGQSSGYWRHYTSKTLNNNWELKSTKSFTEKGLWHSEVKFLGNKYVMLINNRDPNSNFYFAVSSNGDDWTTGNYLFSIQQDALYKASFLPRFNDAGEMAFDIFYTTNHAEGSAWYRKFFHLTTNFAEI